MRWLCVWVTLCAYNGSMRSMLPWELRCVLGGNRSESGIIILYSASEQGYLVLALYKHALLYIIYFSHLGHRLGGDFIGGLQHNALTTALLECWYTNHKLVWIHNLIDLSRRKSGYKNQLCSQRTHSESHTFRQIF